jgi:hypothetical protein
MACKEGLNVQHRTPNVEQGILPIYKLAERSESIIRRSMLNVRCSMFKRHIQVPAEAFITSNLHAIALPLNNRPP